MSNFSFLLLSACSTPSYPFHPCKTDMVRRREHGVYPSPPTVSYYKIPIVYLGNSPRDSDDVGDFGEDLFVSCSTILCRRAKRHASIRWHLSDTA
ncbi:hypothetical protein F4810DRAFT_676588 [Camillea tinctor]|nr:hypothetical protein F4810DRAFT_676588 [Camillea tinctor]